MKGVVPWIEQLNDTLAAITWSKSSTISEDLAIYYGYTLVYKAVDGDYENGSSIEHDPFNDNHTISFSNFVLNKQYEFEVRPYRTMDSKQEYGNPSEVFTAEFKQLPEPKITTPS